MRNIAEAVVISSITDVTIGGTAYKAVNLILDAPITITETTYLSTWPWISGNTENLPGHKDGCTYSITAGKTPIRVMGVEVLDGAYAIGLDPLYNVTAGSDSSHYTYEAYECRDSRKLATSITSDYVSTGISIIDALNNWNWVMDFVHTKLGVLFPAKFGASSATRFKSAFYGSSSTGVRAPWRFCNLSNGAFGGLGGEHGSISPLYSYWHGRSRLSGAGKMRGEWQD
jgi:hypothetical protein